MSTFFLTEEQFSAATFHSRGRRRSRSPLRRMVWVLPSAAAAALVAVQVILAQYIGAGIFLAILAAVFIPPIWRSRSRRERVAARTKRLTSVLYRFEVDETTVELEYDQSRFRMSFENLLITRRNPDYYVIHHELGLLAYIPTIALNREEQRIMDRHLSSGSFDWAAKNSKRNGER